MFIRLKLWHMKYIMNKSMNETKTQMVHVIDENKLAFVNKLSIIYFYLKSLWIWINLSNFFVVLHEIATGL